VTREGEVYTWGKGALGCLGHGNTIDWYVELGGRDGRARERGEGRGERGEGERGEEGRGGERRGEEGRGGERRGEARSQQPEIH
jgi:hypothetical protein